jgi:hypothetical protein
VNVVANVSSLSEKLGVPVEDLPEHINKSKELLDNIELRIKSLIRKQKRVMANYNITMTDLEEYRTNRPFVEALKSKNMELEKLKIRILDMQAKLHKREYEWRVSQDEFEHVNTELERPIDSPELYELAKELYQHPSKHADVIRTMRQRIRTIVLQKSNAHKKHSSQAYDRISAFARLDKF